MKSGKVKVLAVTTAKRSSILPYVPTMKSFYPEFESDNWYRVFVPAARLRISSRNSTPRYSRPESARCHRLPVARRRRPGRQHAGGAAANYRREIAKYAKLIKTANIQPEKQAFNQEISWPIRRIQAHPLEQYKLLVGTVTPRPIALVTTLGPTGPTRRRSAFSTPSARIRRCCASR